MKILTLNTHSHLEPDYEKKLSEFVKAVCEIKPDIIALQEVNQSIESEPCGGLGDIAIRYGYYRYQVDIMIVTVIILVLLVQLFQSIGMLISRKMDKRRID